MTNKKLISVVLILTLLLHLPSRAGAEALDASQYTNACSRTLGFGHINGIRTPQEQGEKQFKDYILAATQGEGVNPKGLVVHPQFLYNQTDGYKDVVELLMQKSGEAGEALATRLETIWVHNVGQGDGGKVINALNSAWLVVEKAFASVRALFSYVTTKIVSWLVSFFSSTPTTQKTYTSIHQSLETFVKARDKISL